MPARSEGAPPAHAEDRLLGGRVRLCQPAAGYRAAIDPVLLAAAVPARAGQRVVDLGCGAGAAALCLLARVDGCRVSGLELLPALAALARENAALNGMGERFAAVVGDVAAPAPALAGADHVMLNPPYLPRRRAAPGKCGDAATVETAPLSSWLAAALALVNDKGTLTVIHRADRLDALLAGLARGAGGIVVLPLWAKAGVAARRVLVRARRGVATPLALLPGLVLHRDDGSYTDAAEAVLRDARGIDLVAPTRQQRRGEP